MIIYCWLVDAFFDGELTSQEADGFREHLADCRVCEDGLLFRIQLAVLVESWGAGPTTSGDDPLPARRNDENNT